MKKVKLSKNNTWFRRAQTRMSAPGRFFFMLNSSNLSYQQEHNPSDARTLFINSNKPLHYAHACARQSAVMILCTLPKIPDF